MAAHAVTLRLPAPLYNHLQGRAERAHRSLEAELLDVVTTVVADEEELSHDVAKALGDLELLNDQELWRAAQNRLPDDSRSQLEALNLKQQRERLTPAEHAALEQLVHQYDQAVLLRAEAARLLKERGHDVSKLLTAR
jgi:plasmid stability protein